MYPLECVLNILRCISAQATQREINQLLYIVVGKYTRTSVGEQKLVSASKRFEFAAFLSFISLLILHLLAFVQVTTRMKEPVNQP